VVVGKTKRVAVGSSTGWAMSVVGAVGAVVGWAVLVWAGMGLAEIEGEGVGVTCGGACVAG
jgi:hypothetical protein